MFGSSSRSTGHVVNVVLLDEAQRRFEAEDRWWREHRDAKELFIEEFETIVQHLSEQPETGQRYRNVRGKLIQRWLMKKTGCHVYYWCDDSRSSLEIHSIWGARKRRGPKL